jgi:predicted ATPase with chaperone activity
MSENNICPRTGLPHSYWPQGNCQYCGEVSPVLASTREERDRLREESRASKVLLESKDETIRQLTEERAEQWRQRREAEGSRDVERAVTDSMKIERDALREAMEGIVHFSDALNFRNDHLSKALSQWIEAGRKLLAPATVEGREP